MHYDLNVLKKQLILTEDMEYNCYANYNDHVHSAANIFTEIDGWMQKLLAADMTTNAKTIPFDKPTIEHIKPTTHAI